MNRLRLFQTVEWFHCYSGGRLEAWYLHISDELVAEVAGGTLSVAPVPEPATILPLLSELAGLGIAGWRHPPQG